MCEYPAASVTIEHHFDAAPQVVWQAWTIPEMVRRWWGSDPEGVVTFAALDVRVGGRFEISFRDASGDQHTSSGEYLRVEPMRVLDFTWGWLSEPGNQSRVAVELTADGQATVMRFVHAELRGATEHDYEQGWRRTFTKLDEVLTGER